MTTYSRQTRRPTDATNGASLRAGPKAGVGVDRYGGSVIDPTENVLALVDAQAKFQEKIDAAADKFNALNSDWIVKHFESLIDSERRRIDNLADMKKDYDKAISETQTGQMKTTSDLVSTQLDKVTTSLSDTINKTADNIASTLATMDKRLSGVEQFRYETGGRASATDPAMTQLISDIRSLKVEAAKQVGGTESEATKSMITALELQKMQAQHGGVQNIVTIISAIIAALAIATTVFIWRTGPQQSDRNYRPAIVMVHQ